MCFQIAPMPNVVGVLKGTGGGRSLMLNGHIDVVPPGDLKSWTGDPYTMRVDGDRLIGRGVTDMKGGMAGMLAAIRKVQQAGPLRGDVIFESVIGEERGEPGTKRCVERGYRADFAIVGEAGEARHALAGVGTATRKSCTMCNLGGSYRAASNAAFSAFAVSVPTNQSQICSPLMNFVSDRSRR